MKKTLIALAAVALTGAAFAQSNVTLYGKANVGISKASGATARMANGADGSSSRWGIKGSEDLGGGLKANFLFEQGVDITNGDVLDGGFDRQAYAGLSGGFGEVRFGRQYTLAFFGSAWSMPSTSTNAQITAGLGFLGAGSRNDAQIQYWSPKFNGLQVRVATQLKGNTATPATEVALNYTAGSLSANLNMSKVKGTAGSDVGLNVAYNMGDFTLAGGYIDEDKASADKGYFLHVGANNMGAFKPYVQVARNTGTDVTAYNFGTTYALSKRSSLYAHYGKNNSTKASLFVAGIDHNF